MALTTRAARPADPLDALLTAEPLALDTPAARRALRAGVLEARRESQQTIERLLALGKPLLLAIVAVSFLHVFDTIAAIRPASVAALRLPDWLYHVSAAALTITVDAAALFIVATGGATALAGLPRRASAGLSFFMVLTLLLNGVYVLRYAPEIAPAVKGAVLPAIELSFALLLPAVVPIGLAVIERALARLRAARLRLLVEIRALEDLTRPAARTSQNAPEPILREAAGEHGEGSAADDTEGSKAADDAVVSPGRPAIFTIDDLPQLCDGAGALRRSDVIAHLRCSDATADRLLSRAVERGLIRRGVRGVYYVAS